MTFTFLTLNGGLTAPETAGYPAKRKEVKNLKDKNTFIMKMDYESVVEEMSDKQAGMLIKAIYKYVATGDAQAWLSDVEVKMAFRFIKNDLDAFSQKYDETCARNAENAKKGGAKKGNQNARKNNRSVEKQPKTTERLKNNPNDIDIDIDIDNDSSPLPPRVGGEEFYFPDVRHSFDAFREKWEACAENPDFPVKLAAKTWLDPPDAVIRPYLERCREYGAETVLAAIEKLRNAKCWHGKNMAMPTFLDEQKFSKLVAGEYENEWDQQPKPDKSDGCTPIHPNDIEKYKSFDFTRTH